MAVKKGSQGEDALVTAIDVACAATGAPGLAGLAQKVKDLVLSRTSDGLLAPEAARQEALGIIDEAIEPLAGAHLEHDNDLKELLRGSDQVITLLTQLLQAPAQPMPHPAVESDLFLSYPPGSEAEAQLFADALLKAGIRTCFPPARNTSDAPGARRDELLAARALAVFAAPGYPDSIGCAWQLASAWIAAERSDEGCKRVIFVKPPTVDLNDVRQGPLVECPIFALGADSTTQEVVAKKIAAHIDSLADKPLGALAVENSIALRKPPEHHPSRRSGSDRFFGRMGKLWELHDLLQSSGCVAVTGQIAQVQGLGGIGKTLLAIEYVRRFDTAWPGGIFWIDVRARWRGDDANTTPEELRTAFFASLAGLVGVTPVSGDPIRTCSAVEEKLLEMTDKQPYLWVLDDVPEGAQRAAVEAMQPPDTGGAVLMTTRWRGLDGLGVSLDLGVLDPQPALRLLTQTSPPVGDEEAASAKRLAKCVGYHPLALDVLRALLGDSLIETPYATWEQRLSNASVDHLSSELDGISLPTGCSPAISEVLARSLDGCSALALDVLLLASCLAPVSIPFSLIEDVLVSAERPRGVETALRELNHRSLARSDKSKGGLEVHALVRRVIKRRSDAAALAAMSEAASSALSNRFSMLDLGDPREHEALTHLVAHAQVCADGDSQIAAELGGQLGVLLGEQGDFAGSRYRLERVLAARERILGPEHPDTLTTLQNLALTFEALGDFPGARCRAERALSGFENIAGLEHPGTLATLQSLAGILVAQGDLAGAHDLLMRAFDAQESLLGPGHPDTLMTLHGLAVILMHQGDLKGARNLFEGVLAAQERILSPEHPHTLMTLQNLAGVLQAQGDLEGARERYEQALTAKERVLGPEHPETLATLQNLAGFLHMRGDLAGARDLYERALAARKRILGPEHPDTLGTFQNLAGVLLQEGDFMGARERYEQALAAQERLLGPEHPDAVITRFNLILALHRIDPPAAKPHIAQLIALRERPRAEFPAVVLQILDRAPYL